MANKYHVLGLAVVTIIVISGIIYYFTSFQPRMTIASFEKEVKSELAPYLTVVVDDYWLEGGLVRCRGAVHWLGGEVISGAVLHMFVFANEDNSVDVKVAVYAGGGGLILPTETIDYDTLLIPTLGEGVSSFDFTLECSYD